MRLGKRASVDWTVGKLLNIILALVVLALVVYGISTQSLNPLIENIGGKFDEVLILFNLKDDIYSKDCYSENVANLGGGSDFLKAIGMSNDVILNVCKNRMCNISEGGKETYRVKDGEFENLENGEWGKYNSVFVGSIASAESDWAMYNAGVGVLDNLEIKKLYDSGFTKRFVLYGNGEGWSKEVYAVWQNSIWTIKVGDELSKERKWFKDGKEFMDEKWTVQKWSSELAVGSKWENFKTYVTKDDGEAINIFTEIAWRSVDDDDKVYWKETIPTKPDGEYLSSSDHGELIRQVAGSGLSFKADDELDVARLKSLFEGKKEKYLEEVEVSVGNLSDAIKVNEIEIGEKEFAISVEDDDNFPIVVFTSGNEIFGLRHSAYAKINSNLLAGVKLKYFPVVLVEKVGLEWREIGNEEYYRLPKDNFEEVKKATLISEFLKSKCK
ncbi:MAG: hypothetical protein ABIF18_03635 [archaeon]